MRRWQLWQSRKVEFGEHALGPAARLEQREAALDRGRLPDRPHLDMVGAPVRGAELAPAIVGVLLMMRLQRREEVELERNARMARGHDTVGDELPVGGRAEVAVDAHTRADDRVFEFPEPRRQVREMLAAAFRGRDRRSFRRRHNGWRASRPRGRGTILQPTPSSAGTARAVSGGAVATEAHLRLGRVADAEIARDELAAVVIEHRPGAAMRAAGVEGSCHFISSS